jgi:hypothetical protein
MIGFAGAWRGRVDVAVAVQRLWQSDIVPEALSDAATWDAPAQMEPLRETTLDLVADPVPGKVVQALYRGGKQRKRQ